MENQKGIIQLTNGDLQDLLLKLNEGEKNEAYKIANKKFMNFLKESNYGLIDGLKEYVKKLEVESKTANTFNVNLAGIKKRIREVIEKYESQIPLDRLYYLESQLRKLKPKKVTESTIAVTENDILTYEEIEQLINDCTDKTIKFIIKFLAFTGLRITECLQIKLDDIVKENKSKKYVQIRIHGKGNRERFIYPDFDLIQNLKNHFQGKTFLVEHNNKHYSRISITNRIKSWGFRILGKGISAHTFRHSYATAQRKKHSTKAVSIMLGHSDTATTEKIYNHVVPEPEDYKI